jgi:hypothetical protein
MATWILAQQSPQHRRLCGVKRPYVIEISEWPSPDSSRSTINCAPIFNIYPPWTTASVHYTFTIERHHGPSVRQVRFTYFAAYITGAAPQVFPLLRHHI